MLKISLITARFALAFGLLTAYDRWPSLVGPLGLADFATTAGALHTTILVAAVALGAKSLADLLDAALWKGFIPRRYGRAAPGLLADLARVLIWLVAIGYLLSRLSSQAATGIIATSSVGVAVIGFALRSLIADLFAGIAISLERPFQIGEWLDLGNALRGRVQEVTWRSTHLVDEDGNLLVVPNSRLSEMAIRNTSRPTDYYMDSLSLFTDHTVTTHQAQRVLLSAVHQVPEVANLPAKPLIRVAAQTDKGIEWQLKFPIPHMGESARLRYQVWRKILRNLHFAGVGPEPPARAAAHRAFLRRVDFLASLTPDELDELYEQMEGRIYKAGELIVRQGDAGDSLFLLKDGVLTVQVADGGDLRTVAQLPSGSYFGEMSLLTGAPRAASVIAAVDSQVFEVRRDTLRPVLQQRADIAQHMSDTLAKRQLATTQRLAEANAVAAVPVEHHSLAQQFLGRIRNLFGLAEAA